MSQTGIEIAHARLSPPYMRRVINNAENLIPQDAVRAGLLHQIVPATQLMVAAYEKAAQVKTLHPKAFAQTKLKSVAALRAAIHQTELVDKNATLVN